MTPKEKAIELTDAYYDLIYDRDGSEDQQWANNFALFTVDQIINNINMIYETFNTPLDANISYWKEVKKEIKKL